MFCKTEMPLLIRNKFYAIGNYDHRGVFMVHKVYICSNLNSPFVVHDYDQLECCHTTKFFLPCSSGYDLKNQVHSQQGEHCSFVPMLGEESSCKKHFISDIHPSIVALSFVSTNVLQDSINKYCVNSGQQT